MAFPFYRVLPQDSLDHMPFAIDSRFPDFASDQNAAELSTAVGLALRGMFGDE